MATAPTITPEPTRSAFAGVVLLVSALSTGPSKPAVPTASTAAAVSTALVTDGAVADDWAGVVDEQTERAPTSRACLSSSPSASARPATTTTTTPAVAVTGPPASTGPTTAADAVASSVPRLTVGALPEPCGRNDSKRLSTVAVPA